MLTPDFTYAFRQPKDVSGPTFEPYLRQGVVQATSGGLTFTLIDLPRDRMLVLSNVVMLGLPGATQACTAFALSATTAAGLQMEIARENFPVVADLRRTLNWQGQIFILGGGLATTLLTAVATFDAGVNQNEIRVGVHGVVIPRANASPF